LKLLKKKGEKSYRLARAATTTKLLAVHEKEEGTEETGGNA